MTPAFYRNVPGVLVLHAVAPVFERVEAFILDLPAQTPVVAGIGNVTGIDGQIGDVHKAGCFWLPSGCLRHCRFDGFRALQPV